MEPSLDDLASFYESFVVGADVMAFDVETAARAITCIGFAPSPERAIVIPFHDLCQRDGHYWRSLEEETEAWQWVQSTSPLLAARSHRMACTTCNIYG